MMWVNEIINVCINGMREFTFWCDIEVYIN